MAKSMLTTINQIMSIASKAHYINGGNASKILAKDKKGIFTIEQVAETLNWDPVELKEVLQQNKIMCGDYVIDETWGDGTKLSTFALRTLNDALEEQQKNANNTNMIIYVIMTGILCGMFNLVGAWWAGLLIGFGIISLYNKREQIESDKANAKKMNDELPEGHKAKGMM